LEFEDVVSFDDGVEAVELVRDGGGEDGVVGEVVVDWMGEIVVVGRVFDKDVA
jgi:hypothetical protein